MLEKNFTVTIDEIYLPFLVNKQSEKSLVVFVEVVKLYITIEEKILCWKAFEKHGVLFQVLNKVSQLLGKLCQSSGIWVIFYKLRWSVVVFMRCVRSLASLMYYLWIHQAGALFVHRFVWLSLCT